MSLMPLSLSSDSLYISSDLDLDLSDPLNALLHNAAQSERQSMEDLIFSLEGPGRPDWSELSAMWPDGNGDLAGKPYPDVLDFTSSLRMDLDYNPNLSIEPSALHVGAVKYDTLSPDYPYALDHQTSFQDLNGSNTNLATGCASDSSEHNPGDMSEQAIDDPAEELANQARLSAGVILALPLGAQLQGLVEDRQAPLPSVNVARPKLPLPQLPRRKLHPVSKVSSPSSSSSAASTPPPSTPPPSQSPAPSISLSSESNSGKVESAVSTSSRPKTSHTTIERRYRTNLNARIQSLRMAVPALRVLEDRAGGKMIKKSIREGIIIKGSGTFAECEDGTVDVIDERGFVDGVKVARKCSKANVLGKAVEYIRVLKRREMRLKMEQSGLKALISGLVGGPALLMEWERQWREQYGGEEKDEVEGDDGLDDDDESDEDFADNGDDEIGRKRKRFRTAVPAKEKSHPEKDKVIVMKPAPAPGESGASPAPEKRKRGRPRKVIPSAAPPLVQYGTPTQQESRSVAPSAQTTWPEASQQAPQQYMLAVFAIFSFLNSPFDTSITGALHSRSSGSVLNPPLTYATEVRSSVATPPPLSMVWGWKEYLHALHLLASVLVIGSILISWIAGDNAYLSWVFAKVHNRGNKQDTRDWVKSGEECILYGHGTSLFTCLRVYRAISGRLSASMSELSTLALVLSRCTGPVGVVARAKARSIWRAAQMQAVSSRLRSHSPASAMVRIADRLVLETMDLAEASDQLRMISTSVEDGEERSHTPIEVLACLVVRRRVKKHLGSLFVRRILKTSWIQDEEKDNADAIRHSVDAAKELGGHIGELGRILERIWKTPGSVTEEEAKILTDQEIRAMVTALVLYERIFGKQSQDAQCPLPIPSPSSPHSVEETCIIIELRKVLGSSVFEECAGIDADLEDAKDTLVDMVVDYERRARLMST